MNGELDFGEILCDRVARTVKWSYRIFDNTLTGTYVHNNDHFDCHPY
jgi:hypothetical protein